MRHMGKLDRLANGIMNADGESDIVLIGDSATTNLDVALSNGGGSSSHVATPGCNGRGLAARSAQPTVRARAIKNKMCMAI